MTQEDSIESGQLEPLRQAFREQLIACLGENDPGEPRLARAFLNEIEGRS